MEPDRSLLLNHPFISEDVKNAYRKMWANQDEYFKKSNRKKNQR